MSRLVWMWSYHALQPLLHLPLIMDDVHWREMDVAGALSSAWMIMIQVDEAQRVGLQLPTKFEACSMNSVKALLAPSSRQVFDVSAEEFGFPPEQPLRTARRKKQREVDILFSLQVLR